MKSSISIRLLQTQSDSRLVELAEAGSERAFEALVNRYRKPLLGYCRRLLLPEARAEDALQQGLLQAWLALRAGAEVRDAKAWLYRIVHNASISALRRSGYDYVELDESLHGACASEDDLERRIAVREALAGLAALPEAQREVLLRTALGGDSHEQVAAAMGLSEGAVRGLVYRARATLRIAVSALTPPQLLLWVSRAAETGGAQPQLAELVTGAGSAGLFGALLKGGAVLVSVGAIATGATLAEHQDGPVGSTRASAIDAHAQAALLPSGSQSIRARFSAGGVTQTLEGVHARGERSRHGERGGREGRHGTAGRGGGSGVDDGGRHDGSGSSGSGEASRAGDGGFSGSDGGSGSGSGGSKDGTPTSDGHGGGSPSGSSDGSRTNGSSHDGGSSGDGAPSEPVSSTQEAPTTPAEADSGSSRHGGEATSTTGTDERSSSSGSGH